LEASSKSAIRYPRRTFGPLRMLADLMSNERRMRAVRDRRCPVARAEAGFATFERLSLLWCAGARGAPLLICGWWVEFTCHGMLAGV
jgi:hypothetical protein